jgi:hypothetical protein
MERPAEHPVPMTDVTDSNLGFCDTGTPGIVPVAAGPRCRQESSETPDHATAAVDPTEHTQPRKPLASRKIQHVSFELALATGLSPLLRTEILESALNLALGRRR